MAIETFVTLEESVAVFTKLPLNEGTVLCVAQLAQVPAWMVGDFIKSLLALVAVLFTSEKRWHTGNNIVVIVVVIQVQVFFGFWTRVDEGIQVFLGNDVELISRESSLEFLNLWNTAWSKGNTRCFMKFLSQTTLYRSGPTNETLVLRVFVVLCLGYNNSTSTTKFIFVFNSDNASFFR